MIFIVFHFIMNSSNTTPRKSYSIQYKLKIIAYCKQHSRKQTCAKFHIHTSMLCRWIQLEPILIQKQSTACNASTHIKRWLGTPGRYPIQYRNKIEHDLYDWIYDNRRQYISIRYSDLQQKMLSIVPTTSFKAFYGWISYF